MLSPEPFFLALLCTKSFSGWGFAPDLTAVKGEGGKEGKGGKGKRAKRKGMVGRLPPFKFKSGYALARRSSSAQP